MYMEEAQPSTVQSTPVPAKSKSQIIRNSTQVIISSSNDKWEKKTRYDFVQLCAHGHHACTIDIALRRVLYHLILKNSRIRWCSTDARAHTQASKLKHHVCIP